VTAFKPVSVIGDRQLQHLLWQLHNELPTGKKAPGGEVQ
jgi:hypothetical protein